MFDQTEIATREKVSAEWEEILVYQINQIEKENNCGAYSLSIMELDMSSGLNNSYLAIKELLRPE
jgi:hypothetical protein